MNKIIRSLLILSIISSGSLSSTTAQPFLGNIGYGGSRDNVDLVTHVFDGSRTTVMQAASTLTKELLKPATLKSKFSKASIRAAKASYRASENFKKRFRDAPEASWYTGEKVIVAFYAKDDVKTEVVYDKSGFLINTFYYYPAIKTPPSIRSIVEEAYPNADITLTIHINEDDLDFYIVGIEDKRTYKKVTVFKGETNLIEEFRKIR